MWQFVVWQVVTSVLVESNACACRVESSSSVLVSTYQTTFFTHSGRLRSRLAAVRTSDSHGFPVIILNAGLYVMNCSCNTVIVFNICLRICHTAVWSGTCVFLNGSVHFMRLNIYLFIYLIHYNNHHTK